MPRRKKGERLSSFNSKFKSESSKPIIPNYIKAERTEYIAIKNFYNYLHRTSFVHHGNVLHL